jgi:gag-polypeptide of LTR copia-type
MEALLTRKQLLDVVNGTTRHPGGNEGSQRVRTFYRKQAEARSEIILHVSPSQLAHCRDPDPMNIWNTLSTIHASRSCSTIIALRRRFHRLRLDRSETMSTYIARVRHLAFLLEEANVPTSDDDLILGITSGLPHSYDSFLISLDATPDSEFTLDNVIARLVNEYQHQHMYPPRHTPNNPDPTDEAMTVSSYTPRRTGLAHITCFFCGAKGHYQLNCPNRNTATPSPTSTSTKLSKETAHAAFAKMDDYDSEDF